MPEDENIEIVNPRQDRPWNNMPFPVLFNEIEQGNYDN